MAQLHFSMFSKLPLEIRLQIWRMALHQETEKRFVIVDVMERFVYPMRRLISPLLAVNTESRETAMAFFNLKLDVHRNPNPRKTHRGSKWARQRTATGPFAGNLYLSLKQDLFIKGPNWKECLQENQMNDSVDSDCEIVCNYDTNPIRGNDCNSVQRVLDIDYEYPSCPPRRRKFCDPPEVESRMRLQEKQTTLFLRATDCFFLNLSYFNIDIPEIMELGGEGVLALPWVQKRLPHHARSDMGR
ncbi:hypothetical protein F5Y06DRAFT_307732 [Hypoxylon sp. FL0890]|nr:hypothetical protein F5Y06DRAFT_307732 [Hypoxylon sp. FL0890]